ncbi:hypothetical protein CapIbe_019974 [Capra ibex]
MNRSEPMGGELEKYLGKLVSGWMALADNVLWTYLWHLPRRSSYEAAGQQEAASSLSKHHVKQRGSIFHSTQLSIFLEDERTVQLSTAGSVMNS